MRPRLAWIIPLSGLLLLYGAMGWATHSLLEMERARHLMATDSIIQERSRLGLWRMESLAAALVVEESARPPQQYRSDPAQAPAVSPASYVHLHFEMDADGRIASPQVATGPDQPPVPSGHGFRLQELRARLAEKADPDQWALLGHQRNHVRGLEDNRGYLMVANMLPAAAPPPPARTRFIKTELPGPEKNTTTAEGVSPVPATPTPDQQPDRFYQALDPASPSSDYAPPQLPGVLKPAEAQLEQESSNRKELGRRLEAFGELAKVASAQQRLSASKPTQNVEESVTSDFGASPPADPLLPGTRAAISPPSASLSSAAETPPLAPSPAGGPEIADSNFRVSPAVALSPSPAAAESSRSQSAPEQEYLSLALELESQTPLQTGTPSTAGPASPPTPEKDPPPAAVVSDFRALWIKDALFLTRRVTLNGSSLVQGAWIDWPQVRQALLNTVSDLFPAAALQPAAAHSSGGTDLLASLPVQFLPGPLTFPAPPFWSPLKLSLATAWACVLTASFAVALVLRGMMALSNRRAAFVSAVTHELRTPLATFKLYSEMLADGLIRDPAKKQSYLETLATEADRLGHLVENVLSYSRLENGPQPHNRSLTPVAELLARTGPRLHQRTRQAGAQLNILTENLPAGQSVSTDPTAVEQILFNLVDNACKYGRPAEGPAEIELVVISTPRALQFAVRDHGPGLTRAEARKLFRPFHKSAREAAHSAPGVGLGLALCRRLARDLKGSLETDHSWPHGASFILTLPPAVPDPSGPAGTGEAVSGET